LLEDTDCLGSADVDVCLGIAISQDIAAKIRKAVYIFHLCIPRTRIWLWKCWGTVHFR